MRRPRCPERHRRVSLGVYSCHNRVSCVLLLVMMPFLTNSLLLGDFLLAYKCILHAASPHGHTLSLRAGIIDRQASHNTRAFDIGLSGRRWRSSSTKTRGPGHRGLSSRGTAPSPEPPPAWDSRGSSAEAARRREPTPGGGARSAACDAQGWHQSRGRGANFAEDGNRVRAKGLSQPRTRASAASPGCR